MTIQEEKYSKVRQTFRHLDEYKYEEENLETQVITVQFRVKGKAQEQISRFTKQVKSQFTIQRYLHLNEFHCTLKYIAKVPLNYDKSLLEEYQDSIREITRNFLKFKVRLKGVNNFPDVAFIQLFSGDNKLLELHKALNRVLPSPEPQFEDDNFIPHTTFVVFQNDPKELLDYLDQFADYDFGECDVEEIELMLCGKSELVESFPLN